VIARRSLPIADAPLLAPAARRELLLRVALTTALAALVGAAVLLAAHSGDARAVAAVPTGRTTEIVVDVSGSVGDSSFGVAGRALERLSHSRHPVGLVLFSDAVEEALPPGSPPAELRPFARVFAPRHPPPKRLTYQPPQYQASPWYPSFSGGTRMSVGLTAAAATLKRNHVRGNILLLSDLGDAPDDRGTLRRVLVSLAQAGIKLRVLTLPNALYADRRWFEKLEGPQTLLDRLPEQPKAQASPTRNSAAFPATLAAVAGLIAVVLCADELLGRSLRWRENR
jgi:hypothetical protein